MHKLISFGIFATVSLIAILNPLLAATTFITLTANYDTDGKRVVVNRAMWVATSVLFAFAFTGTFIFKIFSITLGAFQIAGGVILFNVALSMLHAKPSRTKQTPEEMKEAMLKEDVGVVPLAIPTIVGPGAITTVLVLAGDAKGFIQTAVLFAAMVASLFTVYVVLRNAPFIQKKLSKSVINVMNRLMGLMLAAVAAQFVVNGIKSVLPELIKVAKVKGC